MWIPTPVYERLPQIWLLPGRLDAGDAPAAGQPADGQHERPIPDV